MGGIGYYLLSGRMATLDQERGQLLVETPTQGPGGEYLRRFRLPLGPDAVGYLHANWMRDGFVLVRGELYPARDTLEMRVAEVSLVRHAPNPSLNRAFARVFIQERVADTVYLAGREPESQERFPVESPAPLVPGRSYLLEGSLSPRFYERTGLFQVRLRIAHAHEVLASISPDGGEILTPPGAWEGLGFAEGEAGNVWNALRKKLG